MAEKEHWWREEFITACPKEEDPISEDSKKTLSLRNLKRIFSMRNLKRTLITVKPKDNAINRDPQELHDFGAASLLFLAFLNVIWWSGCGINFQRKTLVLEGFVSMLPVTQRSYPYWPRDHKLFLLAWYIYGGCLINFK